MQGESQFDDEQVDMLIASSELDSEYGVYGEELAVAMSDDANPNNYKSGKRYVPHGPKINWAAKAVGDLQEQFYKENPDGSRAGHVWSVELKEFAAGAPEG
ncbi:hypothetical protein [Glaciibacter psychrotolerans]|uniref:Uncharacterized protein n=1 Tax=Glaciibacter psychrotolerans TaxID=670054 RepID=A0A7Z0ECL8_9MICO|nr:hypothetical protein [Leifsonia psychrotolerans]NYJ19203.1 hypothetical protein [Leifsonia psychrotolerans]